MQNFFVIQKVSIDNKVFLEKQVHEIFVHVLSKGIRHDLRRAFQIIHLR